MALIFTCVSCSRTVGESELDLVPWPQSVEQDEGGLHLDVKSRIVVIDPSLLPLAKVLSDEIYMVTGLRMESTDGGENKGDIVLKIDPSVGEETYKLEVKDKAAVTGGSYKAVAWGTATLLQSISYAGKRISVPRITVEDRPETEYTAVMIDSKFRWHGPEIVEQVIELCRLYKIKHVMLHTSNYQLYMMFSAEGPKDAYPTPGNEGRFHSLDEMKRLIQFAAERGVVLVPYFESNRCAENDGFQSFILTAMSELVESSDLDPTEANEQRIIIARDEFWPAMDKFVGMICGLFEDSPYIHVGALAGESAIVGNEEEEAAFLEKNGLRNSNDYYRYFMVNMNNIVKKHGKRTMVWEGVTRDTDSPIEFPKDVIILGYSMNYYPADELVKDGFTIVNCNWMPLYIVQAHNYAPRPDQIFAWKLTEFPSRQPGEKRVVSDRSSVLGSMMCFWETWYEVILDVLRPRLPAMSERVWNPDTGRTFEDFQRRFASTDEIVKRILFPVSIDVEGLDNPAGFRFHDDIKVSLRKSTEGSIRYRLDENWGMFPTEKSFAYRIPLTIMADMVVSARLYDTSNKPLGYTVHKRFEKIIPTYKYRAYSPLPVDGWDEMPDFSTLPIIGEGIIGRMNDKRMEMINRPPFAKLEPLGHIDTAVHDLWNSYALEMEARIRISKGGTYTLRVRAGNGLGELYIDDKLVASSEVSGIAEAELKPGVYPIRIKYFFRNTVDDINIQFKGPGMDEFWPFEDLVLPLEGFSQDFKLPSEEEYYPQGSDVGTNLAKDKPVEVSGGTEGSMLPRNAVDGLIGNQSGWHASPYPQWIEVDLEDVYDIGRIAVYTYYDSSRYYQYTVEVSVDGEEWKQVVDMSGNRKVSTRKGSLHEFDMTKARYVRVNMLYNSLNPGVHLNEIMIFGQ